MPDGNFFASLVTMIVALAVLLAGMYVVLYLYKRYFHSRLARFAGTPSLRQVASFSIGPRQRIVVLEINGELIACGVTPSQITFLTRLTGDRPAAQGESTGSDIAATESAGATPPVPSAKPDPVHQFAEVLKQKVRSLKRIN
jgi:flagellar protein FliO/FliZ